MSKRNKTEMALLGLLAMAPMSGYDIKRVVAQDLSHFWHESYGHIYPILRRLYENGLIDRTEHEQAGRPKRYEYHLTQDGRAEFLHWLAQPAQATPPRLEMMLKLYFGEFAQSEDLVAIIQQYRTEQETLRETLQTTAAMLDTEHADEAGYPFWKLALQHGFHTINARLAWCEEALATLANLNPE